MIWCKIRHVICFRSWNGMEVVGEYELGRVFVVNSIRTTDQPHPSFRQGDRTCSRLSTAAARSDLWRRIGMRILLQQQIDVQ